MKRQNGYALCIAFVCMVFCCLLLSGGEHLVAHGDDRSYNQLNDRPVYLLSAGSTIHCAADALERSNEPGSGEKSCPLGERMDVKVHSLWRTDANGNVLAGYRSYVQTVYQAFPLGDGFV